MRPTGLVRALAGFSKACRMWHNGAGSNLRNRSSGESQMKGLWLLRFLHSKEGEKAP
jgi:hypothetical protein